MKHTPGPWEAINVMGVWIVGAVNQHLLTKIPAGSENAEGNARMMAAAPELRDATQKTLTTLRRLRDTKPELWDAIVDNDVCDSWDALRAALARAEGGAR